MSYDDLRRFAEEFLAEFHEERSLPVPIEEIVEFDFELEVVPMDGILEDLEVDAFLTSDLQQIYVDQFVMQHRRRRFRFTLAHELAHFQLHRQLYEESQVTSVRDWEKVQRSISEDDYAWFEFQANSFAGLVLVPQAQLREKFEEGIAVARKAGLGDRTIWSEAGKSYISAWLADQFDVSAQVIEKRLDKDGLWSLPDAPP